MAKPKAKPVKKKKKRKPRTRKVPILEFLEQYKRKRMTIDRGIAYAHAGPQYCRISDVRPVQVTLKGKVYKGAAHKITLPPERSSVAHVDEGKETITIDVMMLAGHHPATYESDVRRSKYTKKFVVRQKDVVVLVPGDSRKWFISGFSPELNPEYKVPGRKKKTAGCRCNFSKQSDQYFASRYLRHPCDPYFVLQASHPGEQISPNSRLAQTRAELDRFNKKLDKELGPCSEVPFEKIPILVEFLDGK